MAELEGRRNGAWQATQKLFEQRHVHFQVWWQLEEQRPELLRPRQRFHRAQKSWQEVFGLLQAFDVGDNLVSFDAEAETGRSLIDPLLRRSFFQQLPER